jgi:hypothetical protein
VPAGNRNQIAARALMISQFEFPDGVTSMRQINLRTATALALILPALATNAMAQDRKDQRGAGPAPHAAPAAPPHIAAPAPAPHIAAPAPVQHAAPAPVQHIAAPAPHINAAQHIQNVQTPHMDSNQHIQHAQPSHVATPQIVHHDMPVAHRDVSHVNVAHDNNPHAATGLTRQDRLSHGNGATTEQNRHGGPENPNAANLKAANHDKTISNVTTPNTTTSKPTDRNKANPSTTNPSVLGQGPGDHGRNGGGQSGLNQQAQTKTQLQAQTQARAQIYGAGRKPTLHNETFANGPRHDPAMRALAHATFEGRFSQFRHRDHERFAERRGFHGVVIGWGGPVFWPYAYTDFVDYTYSPYANDTFWPYAYDDVYDGIFGAYAPDSTAYASVPTHGRRQATRGPVAAGLAPAGSAQICTAQASGLTDWPIERIAQQVGPDDTQRTLLDQLKDATAKAVNLLQSACPTDLPSTPTGRLAEMRQRVQSMLQAVQLVRPALDKFYQSLSDEQKERFISLEADPIAGGTSKAARAARQQPNPAQACGGSAQITGLPINQIQQLLHPTDAQRAALQDLNDATTRAAAILSANCSDDQSLTPPGRLAAMEKRLSGMLQAADTVQPAMAKFYNSLTDEQKARFDRMPPRRA